MGRRGQGELERERERDSNIEYMGRYPAEADGDAGPKSLEALGHSHRAAWWEQPKDLQAPLIQEGPLAHADLVGLAR